MWLDIVAEHDAAQAAAGMAALTVPASGAAGEAERLVELLGGPPTPCEERPADFSANTADISEGGGYVDFGEFTPDGDLVVGAWQGGSVPDLAGAAERKFDVRATISALESPRVQQHTLHDRLEIISGPAVRISKAARSILAAKVEEADVLVLLQDVYFHHSIDPENALRGEFSLKGLNAEICKVANSLDGVRCVLAPVRGLATTYVDDACYADFRVCLPDDVAETFAATRTLELLELPRDRSMALVGTVPTDLEHFGNSGARVDCTLVGYALALWKE